MKRPAGFDGGADEDAWRDAAAQPGDTARPAADSDERPAVAGGELRERLRGARGLLSQRFGRRSTAPSDDSHEDASGGSQPGVAAALEPELGPELEPEVESAPEILIEIPTEIPTAVPAETPSDLAAQHSTDVSVRSRVAAILPRRGAPDPVAAAERRLRAAEQATKKRERRETKRFTANARRSRRRVFVVLGAVAALIAFVLVGAFTQLMAVRDIEVRGANSVDSDAVSAALAEFQGTPLALVDENEVLRALADFPLIQRFAVQRMPPHTLVVQIEERVPVIGIAREGGFELDDAAGVLVGSVEARPEGVPQGGDGLASTATRAFRASSKVVRDMPAALRAQLAGVNAQTGQDVTLQLTSGVEVFWGNEEQTKRKALVLETLLKSLEGREVSHIDVSSSDAPIFR